MTNTTNTTSVNASRSHLAASFRILASLALAVVALTRLTACETTEGAGRDLEKLGDNIEGAAQDAK